MSSRKRLRTICQVFPEMKFPQQSMFPGNFVCLLSKIFLEISLDDNQDFLSLSN